MTDNKYYKILNEHKCHNGYQYKDGLNVLEQPFNLNKSNMSGPGGFYITNLQNIHKFYGYGIWLCEIELPIKDVDFMMIEDEFGIKSRVNKLIIKECHYLLDPDTVKKFSLPITEYYINELSALGDIRTLSKWLESNLPIKYTNDAIYFASIKGHEHVLDWWLEAGLEIKYNEKAIDMTSAHGHTHILEWWKNSPLPMMYTSDTIGLAAQNGHLLVLEWWLNSGLVIKYVPECLILALNNDQMDTFEYLATCGLPNLSI